MGMMQSPMNITAANMFTDSSLPQKLLTTVPMGKIPANISNDGKTIEVTNTDHIDHCHIDVSDGVIIDTTRIAWEYHLIWNDDYQCVWTLAVVRVLQWVYVLLKSEPIG